MEAIEILVIVTGIMAVASATLSDDFLRQYRQRSCAGNERKTQRVRLALFMNCDDIAT